MTFIIQRQRLFVRVCVYMCVCGRARAYCVFNALCVCTFPSVGLRLSVCLSIRLPECLSVILSKTVSVTKTEAQRETAMFNSNKTLFFFLTLKVNSDLWLFVSVPHLKA